MIGICFYAEPRQPCGRQIRIEKWSNLAQAFGADHIMVVDRTGFECFRPKASVPVTTHDTLAEVITRWNGARFVFVEKDCPVDPTPLWEYNHPAPDVIYCFGRDSGGFREEKQMTGDWVIIPTTGKYPLWAVQAAAIVLADRWHRGDS